MLLTLIPLVILGVYLFIAIEVFVQDKIAYVFDSTTNMAATTSGQVRSELQSLIRMTSPIAQEYFDSKKFGPSSQRLFQSEKAADCIAMYEIQADVSNVVAKIERAPGLCQQLSDKASSKIIELTKSGGLATQKILAPFADEKVLILEPIFDEVEKKKYLISTFARLSDLHEVFSSSGASQMYLLDSSGQILMGTSSIGKALTSLVPVKFLGGAAAKQGTETTTLDGVEKLVSYASVGLSGLIVTSIVDKDQALGAVQILIRKSLVFFGILICITVIVSLVAARSITSALTKLHEATRKVAQGDFTMKVDIRSKDEVGELAENFNLMAGEVSRLLGETAQKARMETELQTAKTVQETLFPQTQGQLPGLEISGYYEPASECGGDWWHYCQIKNKTFLWIGDATGHGAPAALITSAAKSASTIIERLDISPAKALDLLNRCIYEVSRGRIMMTFFLASYDPATGELTYSNASHEAPYLIRKSEKAPTKKDLIPLNEVNNPRLGQARETTFKQVSIKLNPGDSVLFYTDGLADIQNKAGESWGEREFVKTIVKLQKDYPTADKFKTRLVDTFQDFRQGSVLIDDVTFFVVKNLEIS